MPSARRALAFALALLTLPLAAAQEPVPTPGTPSQFDCQAPMEECYPDLIPTTLRVEATDERFPTKLCTDFINLGRGASAVPFRILLEIDGVPTAEHQVSGVYQSGEGGRDFCWEGLMLVRGRHTMTIHVDHLDQVIESDETNNRRSMAFTVRETPRVDLIVSDFIVLPKEGRADQTQTFVVNVTNIGEMASNATTVDLSDSNGHMTTWALPALAPHQTRTLVLPTRPDLRPVGTFAAHAIVDPGDNVSEISETNNGRFTEYTVLDHPAPDYAITSVNVTGNLTERRGLRIDVLVENLGDRSAGGTTIHVLNETNVTVGQASTRSSIGPGASATVQFTAVLPAGNHTVRFVVDPLRLVGERDETNNEWILHLEILPAHVELQLPNLVIERIYAMPEDPRPGEAVSLGALVHNVGANASKATSVNFTIDGLHVGSATIGVLPPGAYYAAYVSWEGGGGALYTIAAHVDPAGQIPELDDGDNELTREFLVTTQRPPEEPPAPPTTPTPTPTPETPSTPTPATPTPSPEPVPTAERVVFGELQISTRPGPDGVLGVISVALRNPNIEPVGQLSVEFKVDGRALTEKLVPAMAGAATTGVSSGEIVLPEGKHTVTAELRILGSNDAPLVRSGEYEEASGARGLPGFEAAFLILALLIVSGFSRRARRRD